MEDSCEEEDDVRVVGHHMFAPPKRHPIWTCKREGCFGKLTALGKGKRHCKDLKEAKARARESYKEWPATYVHGSSLSCSQCGDRPTVRGRNATWQRLCIICGVPFAMNGFWRKHGGFNMRGAVKPLDLRSPSHKTHMRSCNLSLAEILRIEPCMHAEKKWMILCKLGLLHPHEAIKDATIEKHQVSDILDDYEPPREKEPSVLRSKKEAGVLEDIPEPISSTDIDDAEITNARLCDERHHLPAHSTLQRISPTSSSMSSLPSLISSYFTHSKRAKKRSLSANGWYRLSPSSTKRTLVTVDDVTPTSTPSQSPVKMPRLESTESTDSSLTSASSTPRVSNLSLRQKACDEPPRERYSPVLPLFDPLSSSAVFNNVFGDYSHFSEQNRQGNSPPKRRHARSI